MFEIERYSPEKKEEWNAFVATSKNGTFLFNRNYMDYHSDRFADWSLMVYNGGRLYGLLPANHKEGVWYSHQGLTYGGLITNEHATAADTVELFATLNTYLRANGFKGVVYKAVPWIYHVLPAEEDLYAIYRECNARLAARDIASSIVMDHRPKWFRSRKYGINRCRNNGVTVEQSEDFAAFWQILDDNLMNKYHVRPVHTLEEMLLLKSRFPNNIKLYLARKEGRAIGGTVLYLTTQVAHAQYISANPEGKHWGAIDAIYDRILNHDCTGYKYFDFGKSTEDRGQVLNTSLIFQKEGFGGRGVCYDWYEWQL